MTTVVIDAASGDAIGTEKRRLTDDSATLPPTP